MEINITALINASIEDTLSNSVAVLGNGAATITWDNALKASFTFNYLDTLEKRLYAINFFNEFGAWSHEELCTMYRDGELNALLLQLIAGDIKEYAMFSTYEEYEQAQQKGQVSSHLYRDEAGEFYYSLNN